MWGVFGSPGIQDRRGFGGIRAFEYNNTTQTVGFVTRRAAACIRVVLFTRLVIFSAILPYSIKRLIKAAEIIDSLIGRNIPVEDVTNINSLGALDRKISAAAHHNA